MDRSPAAWRPQNEQRVRRDTIPLRYFASRQVWPKGSHAKRLSVARARGNHGSQFLVSRERLTLRLNQNDTPYERSIPHSLIRWGYVEVSPSPGLPTCGAISSVNTPGSMTESERYVYWISQSNIVRARIDRGALGYVGWVHTSSSSRARSMDQHSESVHHRLRAAVRVRMKLAALTKEQAALGILVQEPG
jgi:hypothetical protein